MSKGYTDEERQWILDNSTSVQWRDTREFCEKFNTQFHRNKSFDSFRSYLQFYNVRVTSEYNYTKEQIAWIKENANIGIFKNHAQFTKIFNAIFGTNKSTNAMTKYLKQQGITISTHRIERQYTDEQKQWISENCNWSKYYSFNDFVSSFNERFGTHTTRNQLFGYCYRNDLYKKGDIKHHTQFKKGERCDTSREEYPIGTIRCSGNRPYIKVQMCNGKSNVVGKGRDNHGLNEPYWKPLQKKIWEDNYGTVPIGYEVCSLNGNKFDENIENIGIIDERIKGTMALNGWWTENSKLTATAVQWCNLYMIAKDRGII